MLILCTDSYANQVKRRSVDGPNLFLLLRSNLERENETVTHLSPCSTTNVVLIIFKEKILNYLLLLLFLNIGISFF